MVLAALVSLFALTEAFVYFQIAPYDRVSAFLWPVFLVLAIGAAGLSVYLFRKFRRVPQQGAASIQV